MTMTLEKTKVTALDELEIVLERSFNAPRRLLWEAFTSPKYVQQWMVGPPGWTMASCETDVRVGGGYRVVWRMADGAEMVIAGTYKEVVPPERLVSAEICGEGTPEMVETVTFTEFGEKTMMEVRQRYSSKETRDAALGMGATTGMAACYDRLDTLLPTWLE